MITTRRLRMTGAAVLLLLVLGGAASPLAAQGVPVWDFKNFTQILDIAERTADVLAKAQQQYAMWMRMGKGLGPLDRFRLAGIPTMGHDAGRFQYGQPWIEGMDSGDARGDRYYATVHPLSKQVGPLDTLTPDAKKVVTADYATVEVLDSVAMMGAHQSAIVRAYSGKVQSQIDSLEGDVTNPSADYHELTAVADKIAVGEVLGRRLDMANNQLLSHALEQLVAKSKRQRDAEAGAMNGRLTILQDQGKTNRRLVDGADRALTTWRQP